jgi:hypothetical protein
MALSAWVGEAAVRVARQKVLPLSTLAEEMRALMMLREELADVRRLLRIAGGNLNDVARHANSTGEIHAATGRVLARMDATANTIVDIVINLDKSTNALGRKLRRRPAGRAQVRGNP